jgi:hypothetical protein
MQPARPPPHLQRRHADLPTRTQCHREATERVRQSDSPDEETRNSRRVGAFSSQKDR